MFPILMIAYWSCKVATGAQYRFNNVTDAMRDIIVIQIRELNIQNKEIFFVYRLRSLIAA